MSLCRVAQSTSNALTTGLEEQLSTSLKLTSATTAQGYTVCSIVEHLTFVEPWFHCNYFLLYA